MNWKCWFFHKWSRWTPFENNHQLMIENFADLMKQSRACERCNKMQWVYLR